MNWNPLSRTPKVELTPEEEVAKHLRALANIALNVASLKMMDHIYRTTYERNVQD